MAGRGTDEGRRKLPGSAQGVSLPSAPGSYGPGDRKAASGAPKGAAHRQRCAHIKDGSAGRRATPSAWRRGRKGKSAYPAPQRIRAAERWLFSGGLMVRDAPLRGAPHHEENGAGCLKIESAKSARPRERGDLGRQLKAQLGTLDSRLRGNERKPSQTSRGHAARRSRAAGRPARCRSGSPGAGCRNSAA
jgi:hypothetical protein